MGTKITFRRPDGQEATGYFAPTGAANAPGVVVIQEWWGLQDQIRGVADRFALAGYNALAPDLYSGVVVPYHDRESAGKQMGSLNFVDAVDETVRGAAMFLRRNGQKAAITGFCMGGAVSILAAARVPEFACAAPFYGIPPEAVAKAADVKIPLQGHFANDDSWCTPEAVNKFEADLKAAGKDFEIFRYDAEHGFLNEQRGDAHAREESELAWSRVLKFFEKHLR
ncbi:MAG: Carboxymethylenebutenolidase [Hyphomicrobiales bacterium]|nr:Carboxymethylenebutenolidase [Hyphomicrobiales bacterium]